MSPIKTILEWIKDKPEWWQHSVRLSLINGEHSHQHLREIYNLAQIEHGILKNDRIKKNILEVKLMIMDLKMN